MAPRRRRFPPCRSAHLGVLADGAAPRRGGDVVREVGRHQDRVPGREGAGLAVTHAGVDLVRAFAGAPAVAADRHVEGCEMRGSHYFHKHPGLRLQQVFINRSLRLLWCVRV